MPALALALALSTLTPVVKLARPVMPLPRSTEARKASSELTLLTRKGPRLSCAGTAASTASTYSNWASPTPDTANCTGPGAADDWAYAADVHIIETAKAIPPIIFFCITSPSSARVGAPRYGIRLRDRFTQAGLASMRPSGAVTLDLGRSVLIQLSNCDIAAPQNRANLTAGFQLPFNFLSIRAEFPSAVSSGFHFLS